jgi:hypothetical protein
MLAACLALSSTPAFAQVVDLVDGPVNVVIQSNRPAAQGPEQSASSTDQEQLAANVSTLSTGLPFYTASYTSLAGKPVTFNIVGTDPSLGANTTSIPTVLVPLKFVFPNAGNPTLDGTGVLPAVQNSPVFSSANYGTGSVDLGVSQYGDALQRAQFWNLPGFSQGYHVLLGGPSVAQTVTFTVPSGAGNAYAMSNGRYIGVLDTVYFDQLLTSLIANYQANQLPIFVTDDVYLGSGGVIQNCCIVGFHNSQSGSIGTAKTWIYAAYGEPGTLSDPTGSGFVDVVGLSHEVAEWLNDPFVGAFQGVNWIPPALLPGQGGACIPNFETGDPLEAVPYTFTKVTNATTYHLQDEVVLPWYLHSVPSFSANGWYTFQNLSAVLPLVVNSPANIAGSYANTAKLGFAPVNAAVTGNVVYVGRGCPAGSISAGSPEDPYLADPNGKIALIDRGACGVSLKIDRAAKAGAIAVLIGLVAPGDAVSFSYAGGTSFVPSLVITQPTSNLIKTTLGSSPVSGTLSPANAIAPSFSSLCGPG